MTEHERRLFTELLERAQVEGLPVELLWHPEGGWAITVGDLTHTADALEACLDAGLVAVGLLVRR